jgi:hypothetical protein
MLNKRNFVYETLIGVVLQAESSMLIQNWIMKTVDF